ncbi:RHTO0S07e04434g1_1 [Rhodotorula toruloides]|uniref:RHTO0S07e04434g1_1 n=2 Tax=Rhodotorula toruloides TaxID=5286 RepID=A0A061AZ27_RHOTO|nr:uncharacterized protein RHTO_02856 [Rhodotorula toruloides NP11]EMS25129.1 hypothetical protein RHTO_02856 [Rhodotorula toruloides NP11]CDR42818.1 RHTO0S07e04434g1_1 [Rhodotorula toruloides]
MRVPTRASGQAVRALQLTSDAFQSIAAPKPSNLPDATRRTVASASLSPLPPSRSP